MRRIAPMGLRVQALVETVLAHSRLVAGHKQDGVAVRIEGKSHAPDAARCIETKLLQVGVSGALERIAVRPPKPWAVLPKQLCARKQLILHGRFEGGELALELVFEADDPWHPYSLQAM